jgi:hypothetical protein
MPSPRIMGDAGGSQRSPDALGDGRVFHHTKLRAVLFRAPIVARYASSAAANSASSRKRMRKFRMSRVIVGA